MDFAAAGTTADHAYWLSAIGVREGGGDAPLGTLDAVSGGIPEGDAPAGDDRARRRLARRRQPRDARVHLAGAIVGRDAVEAAHRQPVREGAQRRHGDRAPRARADHLRRGARRSTPTAPCGSCSPAAGAGRRRSPARARSRGRAPRARARRASGARRCARAARAADRVLARAAPQGDRRRAAPLARRRRAGHGAAREALRRPHAIVHVERPWPGGAGARATSRCGCACACPAAAWTSGASCSSAAAAAASCAGRPPCAAPRAGCSRASCSAPRCSAARRKSPPDRPLRAGAHRPAPASTCCAGGGSCGRCTHAALPGRARAGPVAPRALAAPRPYRIRLTILRRRRAGAVGRARHAPPLT